ARQVNGSSGRVFTCGWEPREQTRAGRVRRPRDEKPIGPLRNSLGDRDDLLGRLPFPVDDLREPLPQRAMMIDARELERLDGSDRQLVERRADVERAAGDLLEQRQDTLAIHAAVRPSAASSSIPISCASYRSRWRR